MVAGRWSLVRRAGSRRTTIDQRPTTPLSLPLFMFRIRADHPHHAAAADDLALVANPFDRRSHLHSPSNSQLLQNPPARDVAWAEFHADPIADEDADEIPSRSARHVRGHLPRPVDLHAVLRVRQRLADDAFHADRARHRRTRESTLVSTSGPSFVTATVCSKCADSDPSRVTAVQPSDSTFTPARPMFTIGSIASTIPSASRGPRPGSP